MQKPYNAYHGIPCIRMIFLITSFVFLFFSSGCSHLQQRSDLLFQASALSALSEGDFRGDMTYRDLKKHGDTGLGTFDGLDGEMIGLDGEFYQIKSDGSVHLVDDSMKAPFAEVAFFKPDRTILLNESMNGRQFESFLDDQLPTKNIFFVLKIEGAFTSIKARSVPKQNRPYPALADVIKDQSVFEFHNIRGTLIGFRCPAYTTGINAPGYHFHFISADRKSGGHVLEFQVQSVKIEIDDISEFSMVLPGGRDFYNLDLGKARY
jgi:acetolactate decarboxylase